MLICLLRSLYQGCQVVAVRQTFAMSPPLDLLDTDAGVCFTHEKQSNIRLRAEMTSKALENNSFKIDT